MPNEPTVSRRVSLRLFLLTLLIASTAGADPITCEMVQPSGSTATKITLRYNTFWDTAPGHHEYSASVLAKVDEFVAETNPLQKSTGLTDSERAEQLQSALAFANFLQEEGITLPVELTLNPCYYDFSTLETHHDTPAGDASLLSPKLYVARDNLTILGLAHPATLGYGGSGNAGRTRVLMLVPRGKQGIKLLRLTFQGSNETTGFFNPDRYLHEKQAQLAVKDRARYGMLMIGYMSSEHNPNLVNDVLVNGCVFKKVNLRAIELSGNARILGNRFEGALPPPADTVSSYTNALSCFTNPTSSFCLDKFPNLSAASGGAPFGMNWHSAISYRDFVSPPATTVIESNTIQDFVEGIVGGSLPNGSAVRFNTIRRIGDHGFYALGLVQNAHIDSNTFERVVGSAIKIGGHSARPDPLVADASSAAFGTSISDNQFKLITSSAIRMAGTSNRIERNVHLSTLDATEFYNLDEFPLVWIGTYGGNTSKGTATLPACGYYNHSAFNLINNNQGPKPDIFIQQLADSEWQSCSADRSIDGNEIREGNQRVYVSRRCSSSFPFSLTVLPPNLLMTESYPPYCPACRHDRL